MLPLLPPPDPDASPLPPPSLDPTPPVYDQSFLALTPDQQSTFEDYLARRIDECRREMGLSVTLARGEISSTLNFGSSWWSSGFGSQVDSWAGKREMNQKLYDGDVAWRKAYYGEASIFGTSNYTLNTPKRWTRLLASRLNETQLLTDPFFAVMPQKTLTSSLVDDVDVAKAVETYVQQKISESNLRETMQEARRAALIRNDATVKLSWVRRASTFVGPAKGVLINTQMQQTGTLPDGSPMMEPAPLQLADGRMIEFGEPVRLADGRCVYAGDDTIPSPLAPGAMCLLKDPTFTLPPQGQAVYQDFPSLEQVEIDYEGLDASTVFYKDYLFALRSRSLRESDVHVHIYDATLNELRRTFGGYEQFEAYASAFEISEVSRARPEQGEGEVGSVRERIGVHECYVRCDPDETGQDKWIFCAWDHRQKKVIFADYLKNHMKEPPFVMIPGVEKVENRAFGTGIYEMARDKNLFIDLCFNRVNFKASKSGSATFIVAEAIKQTKNGIQFVVGTDDIWEIEPGLGYGPDKPPVFRVNLAEVGETEMKLMEQMIQAGQLEFGIITAADGSASDLNSSNTATGINEIQSSGNSLQNDTGDLHARCFTELLEKAVDIILENAPPYIALFMGDGQALAALNREEIRSIDRDVRLLLTKARSAESLQRNAQATALVLQYIALPKWQQKIVRTFFIEQLRALDVQDADQHLPEPTPEEIAQEQQSMQQAQGKPPSDMMSINYKDAPPPIQRQMESAMGMQPLTPEQEQQATAQSVQAQSTPVPEHHLRSLPNTAA